MNWIPGLGWNVSELEQIQGTDISEHGEIGYIMCHENDFESELMEKEKRGGIVHVAKMLKEKLLTSNDESSEEVKPDDKNIKSVTEQGVQNDSDHSNGTELQTIDVQL